jgi:solute carrier family 25 carnitine/acylcarnitine transporter 20/29
MMSQPLSSSSFYQSTQVRPSFLAIAKRIYTGEGVQGFFRGLTPTLLRAFPVNACAFFVYEGTMRVLGAEKVSYLLHK